ncbi:MAG: glycosyl hydrolase-related protein [Cyclobacteriaceae bacterium]
MLTLFVFNSRGIAQETPVSIKGVYPSVFFKEKDDQLLQQVDMVFESKSNYKNLTLQISSPRVSFKIPIQEVSSGEDTIRLLIPDIRDSADVNFELQHKGKSLASYDKAWIPQRHWEIYMVHSSHHDLGYTDLPDRVLEEHKAHITQAIKYCEMTENWPEQARFHYVIEQAWSALYFMEHTHDEELKNKFIHYLRNGQLELTALFGNQNTDLSGTEELNRLIYPSFALAKKYDFQITSAETNDMPGIHWGLVSVLHAAGIKYLYAGIQDYFRWGDTMPAPWDEEKVMRRDVSGAFYWQGPDANKVLFWYGGGSLDNIWIWNYPQAEEEIARHLADHQQKDYPYDKLLVRVLGGYRDNSLPDIRHSEIIKTWNENWAYPKIRFSNNRQFFSDFEKQYGHTLKTIRGDFNQTDYNIGAISTPVETGYQRNNQRMITTAEKFSSLASQLTDYKYPRDQLNESYERLFLYNEHCWGLQHPTGQAQMAASSQKANHAFQAAALIEDLNVKALNKVADQVQLDDDAYHLVVFNPSSQSRSDIINVQAFASIRVGKPFFKEQRQMGAHEVTVWRAAEASDRKLHQLPNELVSKPFQIVDVSRGEAVPHQIRTISDPRLPRPDAASRWALSQVSQNSQGGLNYKQNQAMDIVFLARQVPAMGYKVYRIEPLEDKETFASGQAHTSDIDIENEFYRISLQSGRLSLYDKEIGSHLLDAQSDVGLAEMLVRSVADARLDRPKLLSAEVSSVGPVFSSILLQSSMNHVPLIYQEIILYQGIKKIEVATRMLKDASPFLEYYIGFPFRLPDPAFRLASVNAWMEPIQDQLPGTNTDAYSVQEGLSIFNDDYTIHWSSLEAPIVRLGEIWPGYVSQAHHGKAPLHYRHDFAKEFSKSHLYSLVSVNNFRTNFSPTYAGDMLFRYAITSHEGPYEPSKAHQQHDQAVHPLVPVVIKGPQKGNLSPSFSFVEIDQPNVELLTMKAAEDGSGLVLRFRETAGRSAAAKVKLNKIDFKSAEVSSLDEKFLSSLPVSNGEIEFSLQAYEIKTIRLKGDQVYPQSQHYFHSY